MRKRYFARSEPGRADQPSAYAARAAATARPTSSGVPWPTAAVGPLPPRTHASQTRGEVVAALVGAGALLAQCHKEGFERRGGAEPVQIRCQPLRPERLVD